jgi:hypothetical protein
MTNKIEGQSSKHKGYIYQLCSSRQLQTRENMCKFWMTLLLPLGDKKFLAKFLTKGRNSQTCCSHFPRTYIMHTDEYLQQASIPNQQCWGGMRLCPRYSWWWCWASGWRGDGNNVTTRNGVIGRHTRTTRAAAQPMGHPPGTLPFPPMHGLPQQLLHRHHVCIRSAL